MNNPLTKKLGPLPVGVWGLIGAGGIVAYRHFQGGGNAAPPASGDPMIPADPGVSSGGGSVSSGDGGSLGTGNNGASGDTLATILGDVVLALIARPAAGHRNRPKKKGPVHQHIVSTHHLTDHGKKMVIDRTITTTRGPIHRRRNPNQVRTHHRRVNGGGGGGGRVYAE